MRQGQLSVLDAAAVRELATGHRLQLISDSVPVAEIVPIDVEFLKSNSSGYRSGGPGLAPSCSRSWTAALIWVAPRSQTATSSTTVIELVTTDRNILIYAFDPTNPIKHTTSRKIMAAMTGAVTVLNPFQLSPGELDQVLA